MAAVAQLRELFDGDLSDVVATYLRDTPQQLAAIAAARAAEVGNLRVMIPLVTNLDEVDAALERLMHPGAEYGRDELDGLARTREARPGLCRASVRRRTG